MCVDLPTVRRRLYGVGESKCAEAFGAKVAVFCQEDVCPFVVSQLLLGVFRTGPWYRFSTASR